jgi:uncharacterized membrane protein
MKIGFAQPLWLLLLLVLPWVVWLAWRSPSGLDRMRRWIAIAIRLLILLAVILGLAGLELRRRNDSLAVTFLFDHSESIPERYRNAMINYLKTAIEHRQSRDKVGLIVFGGDASIELMPSEKIDVQKLYSVINTHATDIASALRLAQASMPSDSQRRIVLISDGNENVGDAIQEAESIRANGLAVDVLPVDSGERRDVQLEKVVVPSSLKGGQTFEVKIHVVSTDAGPVKLRIFRNGQYLGEQDVQVSKGRNIFAFPQNIEMSGFHCYTVEVSSPMDDVLQNNKGLAFTSVKGIPTALIVHADKSQGEPLNRALESSKIQIRSTGIEGFPSDIGEIANYDLIVLSNVNGGDLSESQMKCLQSAVRDFGVGLVAIAGDDSFTAGAYRGTPLEEALPVSMDLSSKKVLPSGALVIVVHATEFPDGNRWARDIALAALEALGPTDQMGIVLWDGTDRWLFPIQPVGDRRKLGQLISGMNPGDMPSFIEVMSMAHQGLAQTKAHLKHMVVFSDGDPNPPSDAEVKAIVADKITISTVMIGGHTAPDPMMRMAQMGKGRFHDVRSPSQLPQIFIKESAIILKSSIFEENFRPKIQSATEVLRGISQDQIPELRGYVVTTAKPRSETALLSAKGDPILSQWHYGLGRVAAFLSDAQPKWASNWIAWDRWNPFWSQLGKWALRQIESSSYDASLQIDNGVGRILVDALDSEGHFLNQLDLQATVTLPDGKPVKMRLYQTEPGHYEAGFAAPDVGIYLANIQTVQNGNIVASQAVGAAISYSAEYRDLSCNRHLLQRIATISGGKILTPTDDPFSDKRIPVFCPTPVWSWLLALAVLLFPFDVGIRRVMVDREQWKELWNKLLAKAGWTRGKQAGQADEAMNALLSRKAQLRKQISSTLPSRESMIPAPSTTVTPPPARETIPAAKPTAPAPAEKPPPAATPPSESDYTAKLLAAKKRARQKP